MSASRRQAPAWPLLMDRATLRGYLDMGVHELRALEIGGLLPPARALAGMLRWHRGEVDASMARLWGLQDTSRNDDDAAAQADATLDAYQRKPRLSGRAPPRRAWDQRSERDQELVRRSHRKLTGNRRRRPARAGEPRNWRGPRIFAITATGKPETQKAARPFRNRAALPHLTPSVAQALSPSPAAQPSPDQVVREHRLGRAAAQRIGGAHRDRPPRAARVNPAANPA